MQNQACVSWTAHLSFQLFPLPFFCRGGMLQGKGIYERQAENNVGF